MASIEGSVRCKMPFNSAVGEEAEECVTAKKHQRRSQRVPDCVVGGKKIQTTEFTAQELNDPVMQAACNMYFPKVEGKIDCPSCVLHSDSHVGRPTFTGPRLNLKTFDITHAASLNELPSASPSPYISPHHVQ